MVYQMILSGIKKNSKKQTKLIMDKIIKRKCLWCGKEAEDSPRDVCWQCIRDEEAENARRDEIVTVGLMEDFGRQLIAKSMGTKGGKSKSEKKISASKKNGKKGGRPKSSNPSVT